MNLRIGIVLLVAFSASLSSARAEVVMPAIFSDHMVLQQAKPIPVWGWASPGEDVRVVFAGQEKTGTAGKDGRWMITLDSLAPNAGGAVMKVVGSSEVLIQDVLVGEVWLGSGQSNMAMSVKASQNFNDEKTKADLPKIRMFKESSASSREPATRGKGSWQICTPDSVGSFSATLFFFGRELHRDLNTPIGLINSSVGGTPIDAWIDADVQRSNADLKPLFEQIERAKLELDLEKEKADYERALQKYRVAAEKAKAAGKAVPRKPRDPAALRARKADVGGLFNGKIVPLIPFAIRGALWYQGEANSFPAKAPFYKYQLPLLVKDWRSRWKDDFPFAWAQLPNYGGSGRDWPTVREAMLESLAVPKTGMGINIDIGDTKNIHPTNKQEVGRRLSLWALGTVYGKAVAAVSGPLPAGHEVDGSRIILRFKHAAGLKSRSGPLVGFEITGDGENWHPADATFAGESVVVSSQSVSNPTAVRYAWANDPFCNLINGAGLPATPFRTTAK